MEKVIVITIRFSHDVLSLSAQEQLLNEQKTLEYYENIDISCSDLNDLCRESFSLLNNAVKQINVSKGVIEQIKSNGQSFFDKLFSLNIKELLNSTKCDDLILKIDGNLVHIPWELLYDGSKFLCQRFNTGRMVSTRQKTAPLAVRTLHRPFRMLILADSKGDLDAAYEEGNLLRERFKNLRHDVAIDLKTTCIQTEFIKRSLRKYDIVHFAGHAEYNLDDEARSGWQTADGIFSADDIIHMIGNVPLPVLIFSHACQSGKTEPWAGGSNSEKGSYGLANAFLLSGVQHYIGTFLDIPDRAGPHLAESFYHGLFQGRSIGKSLKEARLEFIQKFGEENTAWMAYMLYGNPASKYIEYAQDQSAEAGEIQKTRGSQTRSRDTAVNQCYGESPALASRLIHPLRLLIIMGIIIAALGGIMISQKIIRPYLIERHDNESAQINIRDKQKDIDGLLAEIEDMLKKRQKDADEYEGPVTQDVSSKRPLTMAIFGYLSERNEALRDRKLRQLNDNLAREIIVAVQNQRIIPLVDRIHLDEILKEHKLSMSDIADRRQNLIRYGSILGARLILFSEICPYNKVIPYMKGYKAFIEVIETETSSIRISFTHDIKSPGHMHEEAAAVAKTLHTEMEGIY